MRRQLWLASNTAVKLFAMFTDNEVPRVRSQIKQCAPGCLIILEARTDVCSALAPQQAVLGSAARVARVWSLAAGG